MIAGGSFPVQKVVSARIGLEQTVPDGFDVLVDPAGDALTILVEVG
jgi:(R,R)-butanediol dehydrogenase/meso-butanediol dehydrogenase/diacetyl reductase